MTTVEHGWGNINFNYRVIMFHLRRIKKVNAEFQLPAIEHNIKKLSRRKSKREKHKKSINFCLTV